MSLKYSPWTADEIARLREMRERGESFDSIAFALGRTRDACVSRAHLSGIYKRPDAKKVDAKPAIEREKETYKAPSSEKRENGKIIPCLRCHQDFRSQGPHNRLCIECRNESVSVFDSPARIGR